MIDLCWPCLVSSCCGMLDCDGEGQGLQAPGYTNTQDLECAAFAMTSGNG